VAATLTAQLWDTSNAALVASLPDSFARSWQDPLNDAGRGSLSLKVDDSVAASCTVGRHIRFLLDGDYVYTWRIDRREAVITARDEEYGQVLKLSGRGHVARWDDAVVYPYGGINARPASDVRPFTWASPEVSTTGWSNAVVQRTGASTQVNLPSWTVWPPRGWPAPVTSSSCSWIYSRAAAGVHPTGYTYYRTSFTIGADQILCFFVTGDDRVRLFLDGITLVEWTDQYPTWSLADTHRCTVEVTAGTHELAIQCENYDFTGDPVLGWSLGSPGGVLCAVHTRPDLSTFSSSSLVVGSSSSWKCLDYPSVVPAPTPGKIIQTLLTEAQARSALTGWSLTCTDTVDSAGNPWDTPYEFAPRVGDTYLQVLKALAADQIDFYADPGALQLNVYNKGTSVGVGPTYTVGSNITELVHVTESAG
jgi:hypothetical protein